VDARRTHVRKRAAPATGFAKVLVPLDGSTFAEGALNYVEQLTRAEVLLLRAVASAGQLVSSAGGAPNTEAIDFVALSEDGRREAQTYLEAIAARLRTRDVQSRTVVVLGDAAGAITRAADESNVDVIAMTTHGRGGIERLVFGSVADAVLRDSTRPVFLVPMRERERVPRPAGGQDEAAT
jgi:nucleotide-binding universal stress UspA family protein